MTGGENLQDHIKTLETNIKEGISDQEIAATNDAIDFLKNNTSKNKDKINDKITESKSNVASNIQAFFLKDNKIDQDKIKDLTEAQTQAYINIITWLDNSSLSDIQKALETRKTKIQEQQEEKRLNLMLEGPYTKETAINFIENIAKEDFNKILDKIVNKQTQPVIILGSLEKGKENTENISLTNVPEVGTQEYKLLQIITAYISKYIGESDTKKIGNVKIGKAKQETSVDANGKPIPDAFADNRFSTDEWIISYDTYTRTEKKDEQGMSIKDNDGNPIYTWAKETPPTPTKLVRGDDRKTEETIAEQYQIMDFTDNGNFAKMSYVNDKTDIKKTGLNAFDDKGTFVKFEQFLKTKDTAYMSKNISTIIEALLAYTPQCVDNKPTEYKNGHAKALSDYMSTCTDTGIILTYLKYMTPNNLNLLGVDKPNRVANYNNVLFQDPKNNIMRPSIQKAIESITDPNQKKDILNQIAGVKNAITEKTSMSVGETITKGFDGLLDAFGPMLFGILKMFGIGKTTLYKRFPSAKEKIDTEFKKNYSLKKDAFDAINQIAENYKDDLKLDYRINEQNKIPTKYPTGKDFKDTFKNNISEYITQLKTNSKNINVGVVNACVQMYNKTNNTSININDIVTIETTKIDGKEVKTIAGIKNDGIFTEIMTNYLQSDTPWDNIATANKKITTLHIEDNKSTNQNAQGLDITTAQNYLITTEKQLVKYLTASLFSDKDLEYIMTENGLETQQPKVPEVKTIDMVYKTTIDNVNFRDETDPNNKKTSLTKGTEVKAVIENSTKTPIEKTGTQLGITSLPNEVFVQVVNGDKTGYIAKEYLQQKTT